MNETFASLLKLQGLDLALHELAAAKAAVLPRRAQIQDDQRKLLAAFEDSKKALNQAQLDKKRLEGEAEAKEQAVRKHTGELNGVKSNDAYKALLTEIENAKKEKASFEDSILELMESQEKLQKDLQEREKTLSADKAALAARLAALDDEEKKLEASAAEKAAERASFSQTLPPDSLQEYEAVRRGRAGHAVLAEVKDLICRGCRTHLTADVVNTVMKGREVVRCETCSRILYILPAPVPAPAAPSTPA